MEKERLLLSIGRFDHYYDSINNKCSVFLALSTFIVSGLVASYPTLIDRINCGWFFHCLMSLLLALGLAIMIVVALASTPFRSSKSGSLLYFRSIAELTQQDFCRRSESETEDAYLIDLRKQTYALATGLESKFSRLRIAGILLVSQFFLFIPLVINILINIKK